MLKFVRSATLFAVAVLATFVVFEVYLQAAEIQMPMETRIDPEYGPAYVAGARVTRFNEGFYIGGVNEQGFYGPVVAEDADDGERRVLLLGDSYVMGITVFDRDHFARLLEADLAAELPFATQVLNFGRADFNFWNMYQYYRDFSSRWDHDLVLFFVKGEDLVPKGQGVASLYPVCRLEGDSLSIDYGFRESAEYATYHRMEPAILHSSLFRLAFNTSKMVQRGELPRLLFDKFVPPRAVATGEKRMVRNVRADALPPVTRAILAELARDERVVIVDQGGVPPALRAELESFGMPVWDLGREIEALLEGGKKPYYWEVTGKYGHWNHATHRAVSDFLRDRLAPRLVAGDP